MRWFAGFEVLAVAPVALLVLRRSAGSQSPPAAAAGRRDAGGTVLGLHPNVALGIARPRRRSAAACRWRCRRATWWRSAATSASRRRKAQPCCRCLLGCAFISRQFWGWLSDRIGGLRTILAASAFQFTAMTGFLLTQNEFGLFTVSALFGLGFSGLIPAYVLAVRELFPPAEASWRVPDAAAVQRLRHGGGRLAGRLDLRPRWLLRRRLRHRPGVQPAQSCWWSFPLVLQWRHLRRPAFAAP